MVKAIADLRPDHVFLDIQMPRLTGLAVLELTQRDHGVIVTTAYDQYALKAFDLRAVYYLLKPFSHARFDDALARARTLLGQPYAAGIQALATQPLASWNACSYAIVTWCMCWRWTWWPVWGARQPLLIHTQGKGSLKTQSLSELEGLLEPALLARVHRSWSINLGHLKNMERVAKDGSIAVLHIDQQIPIWRAGHERVKALI